MDSTGFYLLIALVCGAVWLFLTLKTSKKNKNVDKFRDEFDRERDALVEKGEWDKLLYNQTKIASAIFASGEIFTPGNFNYLKGTLGDIIKYGDKCTVTKIDVAGVRDNLDFLERVNAGEEKDVKHVKERAAAGTKIVTDAYGALATRFGA